MERHAKLIEVHAPSAPEGVVLVLHGGAARREDMRVSPTQLSVLRMIPIARRIARAGGDRLAVFRLLNARRGWDTTHTPVQDVRWALAEIADRFGPLPTCLVGHSLGGRAALLSAGAPAVRGVVALAPWVYATDVAPGAADRRILIVHGARDRVASPDRSAALARALGARYLSVPEGKHAMLRHGREFIDPTIEFVIQTTA
ncbi:lysophospholipase [Solirubrobacter taibaiensis]|nr:lysophospholipase [Solirubrobacter taibaiensis]